MNYPKLHHYVPRFYLERFTDAKGRLWAWDKTRDVSFATNPVRVAAETHFYRQDDLAQKGYDPLTLERQLADNEGQVSLITNQWINWLGQMQPRAKVPVPRINRKIVSLFICLQYLRTADLRDILAALASNAETLSSVEQRRLHTALLWDEPTFRAISDRIRKSYWIFGRNTTGVPFVTSDNPVTFRTPDNKQWVKAGIMSQGVYAAYPLSPNFILFCHDRDHWSPLRKLDCCISPVKFTEEMVESENTGQVFMAGRFVFSKVNDFEKEREFCRTIGTDVYAPKESGQAPDSD